MHACYPPELFYADIYSINACKRLSKSAALYTYVRDAIIPVCPRDDGA